MWTYRAALLKVIDADTIRIELDHGCYIRSQQDIRLLGVSAPELNQPGGTEARQYTVDWMSRLLPGIRWPLLIRTDVTTAGDERRSFTRWLGSMWDITDPTRHLNSDLITYLAGHPEWGPGE